ncbi:protein KRI1 homolog [Cynara cardunculus var. scolymus]|uniref:protein KRI1 homolog n=1 Tax=Cynara cardunculus var. scolymus TaxID=59895 RepID=UPI000D624223|nr:protein KRI1 homolog [Cynara cardunculus var. scolymus]
MGMKLFDDGGSDSDGGVGDISKIEINEEFAKRYEHNKKREDLQRFEELKKKGIIDSDVDSDEDDESSEDEEDLVKHSSKHDLKFFNALIKVRNQDPSLKNKDAKLFDSDNEDDDDGDEAANNNKEKKKKPMYLKDVTAKHLIEEGPEFEDEDEDKNKNKKKSYFEEQELLRKEFLDAVADENDEGEFLKEKNDDGEEDDDDDREYEKKLDEYFEEDEKLDENEKFLKDYFRKKMWLDKNNGGNKGLDEDGPDVMEDEEELERQEDYEREFNFRFEENAGDRVMGFSRKVEGSVRKKDNARKLQRKNKEERMAQAEFERKEELKHLKNLKKKEMNEKLRKIRETAGIGEDEVCLLDEHDLEEEFDPEEYDSKMKKAFDEKFYNADDVDPDFGSDAEDGELEKPNFDEDDDLLGLPKGWDDQYGSSDGFLAARQRILKSKVDNGGDEEQPQDEEETIPEEGKKKRKRRSSQLEEEVIAKELEEYYKLDYEDTIGDLKTRFKYRTVNKNTYGLKAKEILAVDDKELNQLVPLKKLATYREDEFIVPRHKIKEHKQRIKALLKGETSDGPNNGKKQSKHDVEKSTQQVDDAESEKPKLEARNGDQKVLSRKQRRKQRLSEFKLPPSRLLAYQKIKGKSNNKRKH